jgi:hypothetical protein
MNFPAFPEVSADEDSVCVHHWVIDVPAGPVSTGTCRLCGEVQEFCNYLELFSGWDEVRTFSQPFPEEPYQLRQFANAEFQPEEEG